MFFFNYDGVMSLEIIKQMHESWGLVVFLLLRAPTGVADVADVSVSRCCNCSMVKPRMCDVQKKNLKKQTWKITEAATDLKMNTW